MQKVYILHENDEWTEPLCQALEELEVPYETWHLSEGNIDLTAVPPEGVFYNRMSASSHTRGHRYAPEYTAAIISWLEGHGRFVYNGSRALQLEISKVAQYASLEAHGIDVPATAAAIGDKAILDAAKNLPTAQFITKHNRAGKGLGVQLFRSVDALEAHLNSEDFDPSIDGITLLQDYIYNPDAVITRCEFIDGKFLYAVEVDTSEGFELCPADACEVGDAFCPTTEETEETKPKFRILEGFTHPVLEKYEAFLKTNGIQFAGIEFIQDENGEIYTYDVNTNTNYNSDAEEKVGIFAMKEVAKVLQNALAVSAN